MNYSLHYTRLIERSRSRVLEGYKERHHIVPRCLGGTDDKSNIAVLTAEEHFVAHQLLVKMYPGNRDLVYATQLMTLHQTDRRVNNKLFGWLRKRMGETMSVQMKAYQKEFGHPKGMKDKKQTESTKKQISASQKIAMTEAVGVKVYVYDLDGKFEREFRTLTECAEYLGSTPINVKVVADGTKQSCKGKQISYVYSKSIAPYVRKTTKGIKKTAKHKENQSKAMKGREKPKGWAENHSKAMKRYHATK
jgi:hypothetical protein